MPRRACDADNSIVRPLCPSKTGRRVSKPTVVQAPLIALLAVNIRGLPAASQGLEHGMKMMAELQGTDSSGFTLMVVSIFIIMGCALTLITITAMYTMKHKQKKRP
jgi:hypothetical protein